MAEKNLNTMLLKTSNNVSSYSNWASLMLNSISNTTTFVVTGAAAAKLRNEMAKNYYPNLIYAGAESKSNLAIFFNRFKAQQSWIYICKSNNCLLPVQTVSEAAGLI
jgi:uncharacterized protein YyaL (SSP411 family)